MKKEKYPFYVDASTKHFVIYGKRYVLGKTTTKKIDGVVHKDKIILEEIDVEKQNNLLDEIAKKIKKGITVEKIIREAISKQLGSNEIKQLAKLLRNGKAKVKEQDGCYGIIVKGKHFTIIP